MKQKPSSILILGAGPAGLACAMELWRHQPTTNVTIVEKNNQVGGLARTITFTEGSDVFRTDIGPHRFYSKNPYLYQFIGELLGEDWITVNRLTRFYIRGKFYLYPIRWRNALKNMGIGGATRTVIDFLIERIKDLWRSDKPKNFEEYAIRTFGRTLAELNMLNYTEKIWGVSCRELSVDWSQRIKGLSFWGAIKNAFTGRGDNTPKTMIDQFYYPALGAGQTYERIQEKLSQQFTFLLNSTPVRLTHQHQTITSVTISTPQGEKILQPYTIVSSIPITTLVTLLDPLPPPEILSHMQQLRYRAQVYLFVTINKKQVFPDQWIYLPETHIPFGRVSEMKNFSPQMAPAHATSLLIEFFCWEGDNIWQSSKEELMSMSLPFFEQWNWFTAQDIRQTYLHKQSHVYPVYDLAYAKHLHVLKQYVDSFTNLHSIGRPGRFKYNNQDHSLEMGIAAAQAIHSNTHPDYDELMKDEEYLEAGKVPPSTEKHR